MNRESEIHQALCAWLEKHGFGFIHCRTDRKSTVQVGMPDFLIARDGRCLFIEIKRIGAKRSPAQIAMAKKLEAAGNTVEVAYSLPECIFAVTTLLGKQNDSTGNVARSPTYSVRSTTANYAAIVPFGP